MPLVQPLKYYGGKHYLAKWIISKMPPHVHYVEPYFGGGSVLLTKDPQGVSEVVNDIDGRLMNFWAVLQDPTLFAAFQRRCKATPFSQQLWEQSRVQLDKHPCSRLQCIPCAVACFVLCRQSRAGQMRDFATLSRNRTRGGMNEQVSAWLTAVEGLPDVHARLQRVVILNGDALEVIRTQDGSKTLFYCDPPYLPAARVTAGVFRHEVGLSHHQSLLRVLKSLRGKFLLSGYRSVPYDRCARELGWNRADREIDCKVSGSKIKPHRTECLWMNY